MLGCLELSSPAQGNNGPVVVFIRLLQQQVSALLALVGVNGSTWDLISLGLLSEGLPSALPKLGLFYFV